MEQSNEQRLIELEAMVRQQQAEIDGLVGALSDLLAAHAVLNKDVRLCSFLNEYRESDREKAAQGGTTRVPASYFMARGEIFDRLLEQTAGSLVFDRYWSRSLFEWREEKQVRALQKIREAVKAKVDG